MYFSMKKKSSKKRSCIFYIYNKKQKILYIIYTQQYYTLFLFFSQFIINKKKNLPKGRLSLLPGNVLVSQGVNPTTFDAKELNFCVRYGYRCVLFAIATRRKLHTSIISSFIPLSTTYSKELHLIKSSTYQYQSAECVTTLTLLTYSPCRLQGVLISVGNLISRGASCLDAFSSYPFHIQLPSYATGVTTGTPLICPSRSSRTKDSSSQISYAHDGQGPNCLTTF